MIKSNFNLNAAHPSWHRCLELALAQMDAPYLEKLQTTNNWLPGPVNIFNAFSLPLTQVNYLLMGESPYPRAASANGYAFWDAEVSDLWSAQGMSKRVNRATSLRNIIKMLLVAEGLLAPTQTTQAAIAALNKKAFIQTNHELFERLLDHGFLLLNATPVFQGSVEVKKDALLWQPFLSTVIQHLMQQRPQTKLILLGKIATTLEKLLPPTAFQKIHAEHPYNLSFINNTDILNLFRPLHLIT